MVRMSVDLGECDGTEAAERSMIRSPETRVENLAATLIDHDHVAESSPQEITMQKPSKQKEHWWDFGMVFSDINNRDASVDLMNIEEGLMDRRVATLHRSMSRGTNVTEYLLACKFKLCEGQRQNSDVAAMDADNDIATLGESSYDCEILSHTLYENPFLWNRIPLYAFTPAANYTMDCM
ncbi:unnamed protein product [Linum tenue]|uniref:Uncharacterized protein n=1 Tax=Linum tenue TaxID=586396 RepID=A0AAV0J3Z5_9ROSI|nr:unnamed protein product [Linum tenue]